MFLLQEMEDQPQYQHLVDPLQSDESVAADKRESLVPPPAPAAQTLQQAAQQQDMSAPIQLKLPLTLDFDDLAGVGLTTKSITLVQLIV